MKRSMFAPQPESKRCAVCGRCENHCLCRRYKRTLKPPTDVCIDCHGSADIAARASMTADLEEVTLP